MNLSLALILVFLGFVGVNKSDGQTQKELLQTAMRLEDGRGVKQDRAFARKIYANLCERDNGFACKKLGFSYYFGKRSKENLQKGLYAFEKACNDINLHKIERQNACQMVKTMEEEITKETNSPAYKKIQKYQTLCDDRNTTSCTLLADEYYIMRDFKTSYPLYVKMCEKNDQESCRMKGTSLRFGYGVTKDEKAAFEVYKKSCDSGYMASCAKVGLMYYFGSGVRKDFTLSNKYYSQACENGYAHGCSSLRQYYEWHDKNPKKIQEYFAKANTIYKKECDTKNATSCYFLGLAFKEDSYEKKDIQKAIDYFHLGCKYGEDRSCDSGNRLKLEIIKNYANEQNCIAGDVKACRDIAYEYASGKNIPKDINKSITYNQKPATVELESHVWI